MDLTEIKSIKTRQISALKENGIESVEALAMSTPFVLEEFNGISEKASKNLIWEARDMLNMSSFKAAEEIQEDFDHITTGSKNFDEILDGGVSTGRITEVFGAFKSGKTCLSHTLSVSAQLPKEYGGLSGAVLFLDTENTFSKEKIKRIAKRFGMNDREVLRNIYHARIYSTDHQMQMVREAEKLIKEKNIKLLVIDSLMALMRSEYVGIGMLASRQQVLNRLIHDLSRIAETYDCAILLTNQVATQMKGMFSSDDAIGGNIVAHGCHFRIQFKAKGFSANNSLERRGIIVDAPDLAPEETTFYITEAGISDIEKVQYPKELIDLSAGKKENNIKNQTLEIASADELDEDPQTEVSQDYDVEFLRGEFKELKMNGFEEKYQSLIEQYNNEMGEGCSAPLFSRGLTKDFVSWLENSEKPSVDEFDPLASAEARLKSS